MVNTEKEMELRHYRCVLAVAQTLHFARAAAELGISPPELTKQVQEAEALLGTRLFVRSKRSVVLSSAGALFVPEARRALEQLAQAREVARRAGRGELGAGCAVVPQAVMAGVRLPGVCYRELAGPWIASEIAVAFRRHEQNSAARAWIRQLRAAAIA